MKYGLGIDTGGTYTDAVIYDFKDNKILFRAKSLTVKENLTLGINNVLDRLPLDTLKEVRLVSLSTTLATNACVEGKGSRALLVLIGCDEEIAQRYGRGYGLPDTQEMLFLPGGHNQRGEVEGEPDWEKLKKAVFENRNRIDSFGIVELYGIRNPEFEKKAKKFIVEWTGMPVACAYELSGEINSLRRAATTLLNARLIPIVNELMDAVKAGLKNKEIYAPLVIVRGDGSLMSEEFAREKPVETLLSGPAASVVGGLELSMKKDCAIVDMGGTTSDLAIVRDGRVKLAHDGVDVGGWKTGTRAIFMNTIGLGGDSLVGFDNKDNIVIGPVRAAPLSWLACRNPGVLDEIRSIHWHKKWHTLSLCEFFYNIRNISDGSDYSEEERKIAAVLQKGPLSLMKLCEAVGVSPFNIRLKKLEQHGIIMRSGLTPTDIMHLTGGFTEWEREAAALGADIMASRLNIGVDELIIEINKIIKEKLYFNIVKMLIDSQDENIFKGKISSQAMDLIMMGYKSSSTCDGEKKDKDKDKSYISCSFSTDLDLIGIGAPIHVFLPDIARAMNTRCIIPENAAVANAVGAITGNVSVEETVTIRPRYAVFGITGFDCHSSVEHMEFQKYSDAMEWAKAEAVRLARESALARGSSEVNVITDIRDSSIKMPGAGIPQDTQPGGSASGSTAAMDEIDTNKLLLETIVTARAIGALKWL